MCRAKVQVQTIYCDETEVGAAKGGENLRLRLTGVDEDDVQPGFVVCDPNVVVPVVTYFEAQLQVCRGVRKRYRTEGMQVAMVMGTE